MAGLAFWVESRWTRPFGYRPGPDEENPYTLGYHIGQDVGGGSWFSPIPVLVGGMVVDSGRGSLIGGYVVIRVAPNLFHTYCHLRTGALPTYGTWVTTGDDLVPLARSTSSAAGDNYMGSASDGPHCHFVVSTSPATAYSPRSGTIIDPRPIIRAALGGETSGGNARPFEEEDMLNDDDKNWVRDTVRQEIGGALSAFAETYKDQDWVREAVRQEIGGALSGFTGQIADAVAARVEHPSS
ncbi:Peptidase M23 [Microbacterium laevaniformans OR221]|nr:Peptidase M23 [Microbacterium laevaniformans OR221]